MNYTGFLHQFYGFQFFMKFISFSTSTYHGLPQKWFLVKIFQFYRHDLPWSENSRSPAPTFPLETLSSRLKFFRHWRLWIWAMPPVSKKTYRRLCVWTKNSLSVSVFFLLWETWSLSKEFSVMWQYGGQKVVRSHQPNAWYGWSNAIQTRNHFALTHSVWYYRRYFSFW